MKILVAVKRVIDPYVKIRVKSDRSGVETQNVKMAMNPFDEIAVEEALRWKEKGWASEVLAVSIGDAACQETLRHALALGADRAIHIQTDETHCSLHIAKILAHVAKEEQPGLIVMGKQSIDGDNNQTPQMLAALLNWPQATYASKMEMENGQVHVTREVDGGLETLAVTLPAVISTDLRLNTPRYASLPNIMKAKTKLLITQALASLGLTLKPHVALLEVKAPSARQGGVKVASVEALVDKLCNEARVL
jgi:electron transfer flavoprotein beta subunit